MNPPYISDRPGKSPMGMDLVPVYQDKVVSSDGGAVVIDPAIVGDGVGHAGLTRITRGPARTVDPVVGYPRRGRAQHPRHQSPGVGMDESAYTRTPRACTSRRANPILDLYSPELQLAIEELIASRRARAAGAGGPDDASQSIDRDALRRHRPETRTARPGTGPDRRLGEARPGAGVGDFFTRSRPYHREAGCRGGRGTSGDRWYCGSSITRHSR